MSVEGGETRIAESRTGSTDLTRALYVYEAVEI
jgi:hypothetical protein